MAISQDFELDITSALSQLDSLSTSLTDAMTAAADTFNTSLNDAFSNIDVTSIATTVSDSLGSVDTTGLADTVQAAIGDTLTNPSNTLEANVDTGTITNDIGDALGALNETVPVGGDVTSLEDAIQSLAADTITVAVEADTSQAESDITDLGGAAVDAGAAAGSAFTGAGSGVDELAKGAEGALGPLAALKVTTGLAAGESGALKEAASGLGGVFSPVAIGATAVAASIGVLFEEGEKLQASQERLKFAFGGTAAAVQQIHVNNLAGSLQDLAVKAGSSVPKLNSAVANVGLLGQASGKSAPEVAKTADQIAALSLRAVAIKPELGDAGDVMNRMTLALARGGPFAAKLGISLTQMQLKQRASELGLVWSNLDVYTKASIGAQIATDKLGNKLGTQFAQGTDTATVKLKAMRQEISLGLAQAGEKLVDPITSGLTAFIPVAIDAAKVLGSFAAAIIPIFSSLAPAFAGAFRAIGAVLVGVSAPLRGVADLIGLIPAPVTKVIGAFAGGAAVFAVFKAAIGSQLVSALTALRTAFAEGIGPALASFGSAIASFVTTTIPNAVRSFFTLSTAAESQTASMAESAVLASQGVETIGVAASGAAEEVTVSAETITTVWDAALGQMVTVTDDAELAMVGLGEAISGTTEQVAAAGVGIGGVAAEVGAAGTEMDAAGAEAIVAGTEMQAGFDLALGPIGLILAGITAVVAAFGFFHHHASQAASEAKALGTAMFGAGSAGSIFATGVSDAANGLQQFLNTELEAGKLKGFGTTLLESRSNVDVFTRALTAGGKTWDDYVSASSKATAQLVLQREGFKLTAADMKQLQAGTFQDANTQAAYSNALAQGSAALNQQRDAFNLNAKSKLDSIVTSGKLSQAELNLIESADQDAHHHVLYGKVLDDVNTKIQAAASAAASLAARQDDTAAATASAAPVYAAMVDNLATGVTTTADFTTQLGQFGFTGQGAAAAAKSMSTEIQSFVSTATKALPTLASAVQDVSSQFTTDTKTLTSDTDKRNALMEKLATVGGKQAKSLKDQIHAANVGIISDQAKVTSDTATSVHDLISHLVTGANDITAFQGHLTTLIKEGFGGLAGQLFELGPSVAGGLASGLAGDKSKAALANAAAVAQQSATDSFTKFGEENFAALNNIGVQQGVKIGDGIAAGLDQSKAGAILHALGLTDATVAALGFDAPNAQKPGAAIVGQFANGMDSHHAAVVASANGASSAAVTGLGTGDATPAGTHIVATFATGIDGSHERAVASANGVAAAATDGFGGHDASGPGVLLVGSYAGGIDAARGRATGAAAGVNVGILGAFSGAAAGAATAGAAIDEGLASGMRAAAGIALAALGKVSKDLHDHLLGFWGINSPSRLAAEVGSGIGEGLTLGIERQAPNVNAAIAQLNADAAAVLSAHAINISAVIGQITTVAASGQAALTRARTQIASIQDEITKREGRLLILQQTNANGVNQGAIAAQTAALNAQRSDLEKREASLKAATSKSLGDDQKHIDALVAGLTKVEQSKGLAGLSTALGDLVTHADQFTDPSRINAVTAIKNAVDVTNAADTAAIAQIQRAAKSADTNIASLQKLLSATSISGPSSIVVHTTAVVQSLSDLLTSIDRTGTHSADTLRTVAEVVQASGSAADAARLSVVALTRTIDTAGISSSATRAQLLALLNVSTHGVNPLAAPVTDLPSSLSNLLTAAPSTSTQTNNVTVNVAIPSTDSATVRNAAQIVADAVAGRLRTDQTIALSRNGK